MVRLGSTTQLSRVSRSISTFFLASSGFITRCTLAASSNVSVGDVFGIAHVIIRLLASTSYNT